MNGFESFKKKKKPNNLWFQLLKCEYFLLLFFCDSKLNIIGLWTKQDIWRLGKKWSTCFFFFFLNIFWHLKDQITNQLTMKIIDTLIDYENNP